MESPQNNQVLSIVTRNPTLYHDLAIFDNSAIPARVQGIPIDESAGARERFAPVLDEPKESELSVRSRVLDLAEKLRPGVATIMSVPVP